MAHFKASREKIKWANKHIQNINPLLVAFAKSDFYALRVEKDLRQKSKFLVFDINESPRTILDCALTIGDVLHNLRSALDILWWEVVVSPTRYTHFPIRESREKLIEALDAALEKQQITSGVHSLVLDTIKPYPTGNDALWFLHELNILDKHQLLIPVEKPLVKINGVRLEDDKQTPINERLFYLMDDSSRIRIIGSDEREVTLKDKGHASATIFFNNVGMFMPDQPVVPTLFWVAEEVSRTVEAFELLFPE